MRRTPLPICQNANVITVIRPTTSPLGGVRSIVTSRPICLLICLFVCLSDRITRKPHVRTSPNFVYILPLFFSDGVAISYVFPVLWMTSCFHIMALWRVMCIPKRRQNTTSITAEITTKFCSTKDRKNSLWEQRTCRPVINKICLESIHSRS